ncbi:MAG TPA: hypothetical protein VG223_01375 [Solirubrobacteraceae bacterium]|nr:hypothetical protein [Solirubrobacteraceae bacterium]
MRAVAGFILLNGWFLLIGLAALRAIGMLAAPVRSRAVLAALGPAFVAGIGLLAPLLVLSLIVGIPLNVPVAIIVGGALIAAAELLARRSAHRSTSPTSAPVLANPVPPVRWLRRGAAVLGGLYLVYGVYALAAAPTRGDDARIWSLRSLTLSYYHSLQPEIFLNPLQQGAHPGYPLLQPIVEALMSISMGAPQLRLYHSELWLLVGAVVWSAAYLIERRGVPGAVRRPMWLAALVLFALTPITILNVGVGDADITGSALLALGTLAIAVWLDRQDRSALAFGAITLVAAASTKDEDLFAGILVLVIAGMFVLVRHRDELIRRRPRLRSAWPWLGTVAWFAVFTGDWRLWQASHHLSDTVTPPLPKALSPVYFIDRHRLHQVVTYLLQQTLQQWGWLAAIFLVTCAVCWATRIARATVVFYLAAWLAIAAVIVWIYVTTPLSLGFLIPTSINRTVGVFMVLAALATAHLLAQLLRSDPP